jgi:gliding motility-associated lipoprotein GldH
LKFFSVAENLKLHPALRDKPPTSNHINLKRRLSILLACLLAIASCTPINVYEQTNVLPKQSWSSSYKPEFVFSIADTLALYNIYVVLRHTDAYKYNNIWVNVATQAPGDTITRVQQLDLRLASTGKGWLGSGMGDVWEHRIRITREPVPLRKAGLYRFTLMQVMRDNPLQHVLNAGLRVEKAGAQ